MKRALAIFSALALAIAAKAAEVVVVAHEKGYTTSLATHIVRWLKEEDIASSLVTPAEMKAALKDAKIAFLVGFNDPAKAELAELKEYRARGGRFVVFHSASPALAAMMDVKPLGYSTAKYPGEWSRMDFKSGFLEGCPKSIRQTSTVLQKAEPRKGGKARVIATWSDRKGKSSGDAAWIASSAGFWMTHVLLADGDEDLKAQLLGSFVGMVAPKLWSEKRFKARKAADEEATRVYASRQTKRKGEIHAVWDHSGCGLYPGDWPKTMKLLKESGVTDLFVNVAGAGFAHYKSDVLARSKTYRDEGDQLAACLAAAKGTGIRVHAWILCFTATRGSKETLDLFAKKGWRLKTRDGTLSEYLDPSNPGVQKHILSAIDEICSRYKVAGIHLDFVRWYERGKKPANAPDVISKFVAKARLHVRRPKWFTAAVLGKYPACVDSVGQDWDGWIDSNIVDYVVPMDYTGDTARFESYLKQHAARRGHAKRTIVGIGVTANESRLNPVQVINQILLARKYGCAGVALFDLDVILEKRILPALRRGLW